MKPILVTKSDGSKEEFEVIKLQNSLQKSGVPHTVIDKILRKISDDLNKSATKNGTNFVCTADEIYKKAYSMIQTESVSAAARYSLRRSVMQFGPTGFPFEDYVAEIFRAEGYEAVTGQMVFGQCVPHEVDVVAWNDEKLLMAEVKYHNEVAAKTDLKVALYVKARFDDLRGNLYEYGHSNNNSDTAAKGEGAKHAKGRPLDEGWLITNTKFTETALTYGQCSGLKMLSWNYPKEENLQYLIEKTKLHPVTCLNSLTDSEKSSLLARKIVLCKTLYNSKKDMEELGFSKAKIYAVFDEVSQVLSLEVPKN